MAVVPLETGTPAPKTPAATALRREDPRIRLAQLARLHDEASQTATLANLLGRAPQVMGTLGVAALIVAGLGLGAMPAGEIVVWLALVAAGVAALGRAYARAIAAPFELFTLKAFAGDLSAVMFYAGFAWGAGAFLALAATDNMAVAALFAAVPAALVAALMRTRIPAMFFAGPVAGLTALATLIRPMGGLGATALVLATCGAVIAVSYWMERVSTATTLPLAVPAPSQ